MSTLAFYMGIPPVPSSAPGIGNLPPICNPPENWAELQLSLSFEDNSPIASVSVTSFDFTGAEAKFINNWIAQGMAGGVGLFEGIPFVITACNPAITIFTGVLDLQASENEIDCDRCTVKLKQIGAIDWLTDIADGFTFAYLASLLSKTNSSNPSFNPITPLDYQRIPYVLNTIPQPISAIMMGIS